MTYAKKLIVPTLCVLLGCAGGAAMGSVTAQTWPEPAIVQRWQQECERGPRPSDRDSITGYNEMLRRRGDAGWEYVGNPEGSLSMCFKRPAP